MANKPTTKSTEKSVSGLSPDEIAKLKAKHNKIFSYITEDGRTAYFRTPNRHDLAAASVIASGDHLKYRGQLVEACFVAGDREIVDDDKYFFAISQKIELLITIIDGELKEV